VFNTVYKRDWFPFKNGALLAWLSRQGMKV
jgi:hypothetical protein